MAAYLGTDQKHMDPSGSFFMARLHWLGYWVLRREEVRKLKESGAPKPWTKDEILQSTRFCNVRRMDDKVSKWLLDNWYPPKGTLPPKQMMAAVGLARLINWPDALNDLRDKVRWKTFQAWDRERTRQHFEALKAKKEKVFTGAYIITAAGAGKGANKVDVVLRQIDTMFKHPELVDSSSMQRTHAKLQLIPGIGSFIAGQMVADMRHVWPGTWADRNAWAPLGPGSRRGIAWLQGWDGEEQLSRLGQSDFEDLMGVLWKHFITDPELFEVMKERMLEMHDLQNCLCEFDKFMRLKHSTGRAKNKYPGV